MFRLKGFVVAGVVAVSACAANAATVSTGSTLVSGGGFSIDTSAPGYQGNGVKKAVSDPANAWILSDTDPSSQWIWDEALVNSINGNTFGGPVTFLYSFSLAGYNALTASLAGLISIDDIVTVTLNGYTIFEDNDAYDNGANWSKYQDYGTADGSLFKAGWNTLAFTVTNSGAYPAGLRATVEVEASPVPLPAALPLLGGALAAFGFIGVRRKRSATLA
ncbi:MAG: hypothetical protein DI533_09015 [Cereibacter sphaeroides]|uniref:VPLPA-CTERM sorting domain-containing protein n=1 Tax=Cereibacter sphaeroides TaxID=1063 RepID=A0A2W5UBB1_CERSP|nr:MAG: hypothetical protein DI533_09015 [Cereibacter sphaeroides]